jgi:DNA-binding CsgD family transcriptional regulator
MARSARLGLAEHRTLWELVNECRDLGDDETVWRRHWYRVLGRLTGADLVVGGDVEVGRDGSARPLSSFDWGTDAGFDMGVVERAMKEGVTLNASPLLASYLARPDKYDGHGHTRTDLVSDREWYPTPFYHSLQKQVGTDHTLVSFVELPGGSGLHSGITFSRGLDVKKDFTGRHRTIVTEAQRLIAPLIGGPLAGFREPSPSALAPRVRAVLACLLEGDSDKQVAVRLKLSTYTVNQYVKAIFKHFGVVSRPELLARWVNRGWGRGGW